MKTVVFWVIQQNAASIWYPQNFLAGFWVCFKVLIKYVYEGVCPNFCIPQNNLFLSKVHGSVQWGLFEQLNSLYEKGLACLLQSSTYRSYIIDVLYNPRLSICTNEVRIMSECDYDREFFSEVLINVSLTTETFGHCWKVLHTIGQMIGSPLTQYEVAVLQTMTVTTLQILAFQLHNSFTKSGLNKQMDWYIVDRWVCNLLKFATKFGFVSDMVYIAMYYHKTSRYREALSVIEMTKVKLARPGLMYKDHVDPGKYTDTVKGQSLSTKMRHAVAQDIKLTNSLCFINELIQEQQSARQNHRKTLVIPLFVMLHFVEFLCYRHIDTTLAQTVLKDLQVLVHNDQGLYINYHDRDISWEILGICQQMTGNHQAALDSFQRSLIQLPFNLIQSATQRRIQDLHIT